MGEITEQCRRALEDGDVFYTEEWLAFLLDDTHFNNFAGQLAETFRQIRGVRPAPDELVPLLTERLEALYAQTAEQTGREGPWTVRPDSLRRSVRRYVKENEQPDRQTAIRMCFALGLNAEQARAFLRKGCGTYDFNLRSAEEAIESYCLLRGRPYAVSRKLLDACEAEAGDDRRRPAAPKDTQTLRREFSQTDWPSDEAFFHGFLLPNRADFLGYTRTAALRCDELWQSLTRKVLGEDASGALRQKELFRTMLYGIPLKDSEYGLESEFVQFSSSRLAALFRDFPRSQYLSGFQRDPANKTMRPTTRKILELLFFFDYVYDWTPETDRGVKSFDGFFHELANLLDDCGFAFLYPADPFDWLLLKCVKTYEDFGADEYRDAEGFRRPIDYFNSVLDLSFPETDEPDPASWD